MAHINQFIDHVNVEFRRVYKEGVWVKAMVTQLAFDDKGVVMVEALDIQKFQKEQPEAKQIFRILAKDQDDLLGHFSSYTKLLFQDQFVEIPKGELALYFKISPMLHWQGEFVPVIRSIGLNDEEAKVANLQAGLRIGIDNAILSLPDNNNKLWTEQDNATLKEYFVQKKFSVDATAVVLKRTPLAIVDQLLKMDYIKGSEGWKLRNEITQQYRR